MEKQHSAPTDKDQEAMRGHVRRSGVLASSLMVALSSAAYHWIPSSRLVAALDTASSRLVFTVQWNALSVAVMLLMVAVIGNIRSSSQQINPFCSVDRQKVEVHARVLQNTMEQFVISFVAQLALSTWLDSSQMMIIPIVVVLFVVGRIVYWIGYLNPAQGHTGRAYGLPMTLLPSMFIVGFCVYKLVVTTFGL